MTWGYGDKWRKHSSYALLIALLLAALLPAEAARAQTTPPLSYTFQECDQVKEANLRDELNRITQAVFAEEQGGMDVAAIVDRNWVALNLDAKVDAAVDAATDMVRDEEGIWEVFVSGWSPAKAEELTRKIATYAFKSLAFREAFDQFSLDITADVVSQIRLMTAKSASSALLCVQTFIGDTMSPTLAAVLEVQINERLDEIGPGLNDENADWLVIAKANPNLLTGVGVIVVTQIAKGLAKKLAQQLAGRVVTRILGRVITAPIPLVGWLIGAGLIVWDLFNAREGSLPQIRDALQDPEVKKEIRAQVAEKVGDELRVELPQLARSVSNDVFSQWQEFRKKYVRMLELAESNVRFRAILDNTAVDDVKKLAEFVAVVEAKLGPERLDSLIDKGLLERILGLPEEVLVMLDLGVDPDEVIAWADLAGELIVNVIDMELYRVASSSDFRDRADLGRVLALEDVELIQKVMMLVQDERVALLGLPTAHITQVLDALSAEDLSWLARKYLAALQPQKTNLLVDRILRVPELIPELKVDSVRETLLESQNFVATLNYLTQRTKETPPLGQVIQMLAALGPVLSGELPWALFWRYDGSTFRMSIYVLAGLIILYFARGRIFPRRRQQDVNVTVVLPESRGRDENDTNVKKIESRSGGEDGP